jgi:hypothetical protein
MMARGMEELDADQHLAAAIKASREMSWHLLLASYQLEEEHASHVPMVRAASEVASCVAVAELLATQVDAIGTQTRKLRKRARNI